MITKTSKQLFTIPEQPIDGYQLNYYRISVSSVWWFLNEMKAIYYLNTSWDKYSPNNKGGADLADDWMIYKDNYAEGRFCGWKSPAELKEYWYDCFLTKEEALTEIRKRLEKYLSNEKRKVVYIEKMIAEVKEE